MSEFLVKARKADGHGGFTPCDADDAEALFYVSAPGRVWTFPCRESAQRASDIANSAYAAGRFEAFEDFRRLIGVPRP